MKNLFFSIIIPVYNAEKYLEECLDSCLDQDIPAEDYEIICINDGSTDGSAGILDRYARKHPCIKVITQPNGGIGAARNVGLDAARGEYLWFVDSDDFIRKNCLGELRQTLAATAADRLIFCYYEFPDTLSAEEREQANSGTLPPAKGPREVAVWSSLYRHAFLRQHELRFFSELRFAEDKLFNHSFNRCAPVTVYHNIVLYFYRQNDSSLTHTVTPEALRRRTDAHHFVALRFAEYSRQDLKMLQETHAAHDEYIRLLMPQVRMIISTAAPLPAEYRREIIKKLADGGLFPLFLYRRPCDWFPRKIHMTHAGMGLLYQLLDIVTFYSTTRWGFALLVLYYKLRQRR